MNSKITLQGGTWPVGYCPTTEQDRLNMIVSLLRGYLPGNYTLLNYGSSKPAPEDNNKPWIVTDISGNMIGVFNFVGGHWVMPHPLKPKMGLWVDTLPSPLSTFDGGDTGAITDYSGPMWERDPNVEGRVILAAGTNIDPAVSTHIYNTGDKGGEETHLLVKAELPSITFDAKTAVGILNVMASFTTQGSFVLPSSSGTTTGNIDLSSYFGGSDTPHNNMQPYSVKYYIRRTARLYYVI